MQEPMPLLPPEPPLGQMQEPMPLLPPEPPLGQMYWVTWQEAR
jgi:hypothetical protein